MKGMATSDNRRADGGGARQPGRAGAVPRLFRWLPSAARRASREYPVPSWARWLAASLAVVIDWLVTGIDASPGSYLYLLLFVALMLYPDAQAISVAGLRIERLRSEVVHRDAQIAALNQHVQQLTSLNSTLVTNTRQVVSVAVGADLTMAAKIAAGEQAPRQPWYAAASQYLAADPGAQGACSHFQPLDVFSRREQDESGSQPSCPPGRRSGGPDSP